MLEPKELHLDLNPSRCRVASRIQDFLEAAHGTDDAGPFLQRAFGLSGLEPGPLPLDTGAAPLITEAQLFGFGQATPSPDIPLELRLLAYGSKPLALLHGPEADLTGWVAWAERRRYTALLSSYQWQPHEDLGKGGYSNLTSDHLPAEAGSGAWRCLLVCPDEDRAILGWLCLHFGWDALLGRLLGYPSCCAASFAERWPTAVRDHQGDLAPLSLQVSGPPPHDWRLNVFGRYFGATLIQHFPCRFDCAASAAVARRAAWALERLEPDYFAAIRELLRAPVLYTETMGVALARGGRIRSREGESELTYDPAQLLLTEPGSALGKALIAGARVTAAFGEAHLKVGAADFPGHLVWLT
jgi:hypothetical protein